MPTLVGSKSTSGWMLKVLLPTVTYGNDDITISGKQLSIDLNNCSIGPKVVLTNSANVSFTDIAGNDISKMNVEIKKKNYTSIQDFKIALFSGLTILN